MVDLCIVVVSFNTLDLTKKCLESIFENLPKFSIKVVVVDNDSKDGSPEMVQKSFPEVHLIRNQTNVGFAKANNQGIKSIDARFYFLLNSDTYFDQDISTPLVSIMKKRDFGIASPQVLNPDGSVQSNAGVLPTWLPLFLWTFGLDDLALKMNLFKNAIFKNTYHLNPAEICKDTCEGGWVAGTAMIIDKTVIEKIGLLDEKIFMYAEDVDYCWRAKKAGFKVGLVTEACLVHLGGGSSRSPKFSQWKGEFLHLVYLYKKNYGLIASVMVWLIFKISILLRMVVFGIIGRFSYTKVYAKVLFSF